MRILYVSPYFWPEEIGSAPYCTRVAVDLAERGHSVTVRAFRPHYPSPESFVGWKPEQDDQLHKSIRIRRTPLLAGAGKGFAARIANDLVFAAGLATMALSGRLKRFDATICYVPTTLGLLALALTRPFRRGRLTAVVHDIESGLAANVGIASSRLLVGAMRAVERTSLGGADSIVVLTDAMQDELRALGVKRPIQVLPIWATVGNQPKHDAECAPTVLYSGNFGKKQNLDQLLPLISRLAERRPDVKVVLRGDGSERARLQAAVGEMRVTNTSFGPLVPAAELADSLGQATVHLVPQAPNVANYTLPSKLISVMAAGRPFVSIAAAGSTLDRLAESSGAGLCVGPDSGDALFEAVLGLVDNPERATRMGANGRRYVLKNMNQDDILDRYAALITL